MVKQRGVGDIAQIDGIVNDEKYRQVLFYRSNCHSKTGPFALFQHQALSTDKWAAAAWLVKVLVCCWILSWTKYDNNYTGEATLNGHYWYIKQQKLYFGSDGIGGKKKKFVYSYLGKPGCQ